MASAMRLLKPRHRVNETDICSAIARIAGDVETDIVIVPQDAHLSDNQAEQFRCGDNGIFKGVPLTEEQKNCPKLHIPFMKSTLLTESTFWTAIA